MAEAKTYSQRLGAISDAQFSAATERAGVGKFLRAAPITSGLFGQNVFVTTSDGEFVLRGAPHWVDYEDSGPWHWQPNDRYQFTKEALFARLLHENTDASVPWPYMLVEEPDIFGWPYVIMPRMPGLSFDERSIRGTLSLEQRHGVASALGDALARQQKLAWPFAGDVDPNTFELAAYPGGYLAHVARRTLRFAENARVNGTLSRDDDAWIEHIVDAALKHSSEEPSVYVHGDFKLGNLCIIERRGTWHTSGVLDLHTSHFGIGGADLCRVMCGYFDTDESLAGVFLGAYRARRPMSEALLARMPLFLVSERVPIWEYFTRPGVDASHLKGKTFQNWSQSYIDLITKML
jgi:aminoglycoside phosphotransferase (APT) family kinase protein